MKILKIFGIVVGIHLAILIGVFVVPGCSSTTKPAPAPADTVAKSEPAPMITVPTSSSPVTAADTGSPLAPAPTGFNPDAPATYGGSGGSVGVRFTPTRPNTPAASAVLQQPVADVTPAASYSVKSGDSLWTIAKHNHISVSELAAANNLKTSSILHQGQKLIIPSKTPAPSHATAAATPAPTPARTRSAEPAAARSSEKGVTYTVKPGETLGTIARMFDVKVSQLAAVNNIADPKNLRAGTELTIPGGGWQAPAGKFGRSSRSSASQSTAAAPASSAAPAPAAAAPAPAPAEATPSTTTAQPDDAQPAPSNVPVIHIDENPVTPAPKS